MEIMTISQVSKLYNISTRTLRYYEEIGLLTSSRKEDYAYRVYNLDNCSRLEIIIVLRKLRISLKDIKLVLDNEELAKIIQIFRNSLIETNTEISALQTLQKAYGILIDQLTQIMNDNSKTNYSFPRLELISEFIREIPLSKIKLKEEKLVMSDVDKTIFKVKEDEVRIIYLPPFTVVSIQYKGVNPEDNSGKMMDEFVKRNKLLDIKPDSRLLGFNNPSPSAENEEYGYEYWMTIPEYMEIAKPYQKKKFQGGMYAAYHIKMGDFYKWKNLFDWLNQSDLYEYELREDNGMGGCLEEHLNVPEYMMTGKLKQLDLLIPIKKKG